MTWIERALGELGIALIASPFAAGKGRVERNRWTDQDRLVKKMRLAKISSIAAANEFLERVLSAAGERALHGRAGQCV